MLKKLKARYELWKYKRKVAKAPKNLDETFIALISMLSQEERMKYREMREEEFVASTHMYIGMWLRNNWGLWQDSALRRWFIAIGIEHPDDMSGIILTSFHRRLRVEPIYLEEQIKYYQEYWRAVPKPPKHL
jgi:hypothetical protein